MKIAMDWLCDAVTVDSKALKGCVKGKKRMNWSVCVNDYLGYPNSKSLAVTDNKSLQMSIKLQLQTTMFHVFQCYNLIIMANSGKLYLKILEYFHVTSFALLKIKLFASLHYVLHDTTNKRMKDKCGHNSMPNVNTRHMAAD